MNTNDLNMALYEKMAAEQDKYRDWLKSQPPEEVLNHAYVPRFRQLCQGNFLDIIFSCPYELHELTANRFEHF